LLAESCYDWTDESDGQINCPPPDHPRRTIEWLQGADIREMPATLRKLTRAVCNNANPSQQQRAEGWNKVAYTNFVPVSVGYGPKRRPSPLAWKRAEEEWITLLNALEPHKVIVLGLEMWGKMPTKDCIAYTDIKTYRLENGPSVRCYSARHPSRGPGWKIYSQMVAQASSKTA
jgi:hypothetical protein